MYTLAISLQLFPESLICLRRCSSAGVHGVFVRLFFGATGEDTSSGAAISSPASLIDVADPVGRSITVADMGALRFRDMGGLFGGCGARLGCSGRGSC